jgi:hypothetical protein
MSKRTLRRAAERQARKAENKSQLTAQAAVAEPAAPILALENELADGAPENQPSLEQPAPEPKPASPAQIAANRENAKLSPGPSSPEAQRARSRSAEETGNTLPPAASAGPSCASDSDGKVAIAQHRRSHGLTGSFTVLAWENGADFESLIKITWAEYQPQTPTEHRLVHSLIQHYWLTQRAIRLQENLFETGDPAALDGKQLSLFLRYQTTHERSYYKAERELKNLRKERGQAEIGFESQKRRLESHEARVRLAHARSVNLEIDAACRKVMEAPIPGNTTIPFADLAKACSTAIANLVYQNQQNAAGA